MSLGARLTNVFSGPGEVFDETIKGPPSTANWLVPTVLSCVIGVVSVFVVFSQEAIVQPMREKQAQAVEKRLEKMPKEQRDQAREAIEKWSNPELMKYFAAIGVVARSFGWLFFAALVLWLVGTSVFKGSFTFMKAVEVCVLAAMISALGLIITTLLAVVMGNPLATPGPALLIRDLDASNPVHLMLSALNIVTFWYLSVLSIGLAKLSGASVLKAAVWLFGLWAVITIGLVLLGAAAQKMF